MQVPTSLVSRSRQFALTFKEHAEFCPAISLKNVVSQDAVSKTQNRMS